MSEDELKERILERHSGLMNLRPLAWSGRETPRSRFVGVAVIPAHRYDGHIFMPVDDREMRQLAREWLAEHAPARFNCQDDDAILVLAVIQ
jgi:hypothetical protein